MLLILYLILNSEIITNSFNCKLSIGNTTLARHQQLDLARVFIDLFSIVA